MARHARMASSLAGVLACALSFAQPGPFGIQIPMGGGPMPNYWSGTNCRASGSAQIGDQIERAELYLNNTLVHWWQAPPGSELPLSMSLKVMFDSTHFANGTPVEVKFRVKGLYTGWHEDTSGTDPVTKNKAIIFEHEDPLITPDPSALVLGYIAWPNYSVQMRTDTEWGEPDFLGPLSGANVVYYAGHGNENLFETNWWYETSDYRFVNWVEVEDARISQVGTGLPPFNSGEPSVNFTHLVACRCGFLDSARKFCYPYYMGWGGVYMENQAVLAYKCLVWLVEEHQLTDKIWEWLALGHSVGYALEKFALYLELNPDAFRARDDVGSPLRNLVAADLALLTGPDDGAMRVRSVYTGNNDEPGFPVTWYMPL